MIIWLQHSGLDGDGKKVGFCWGGVGTWEAAHSPLSPLGGVEKVLSKELSSETLTFTSKIIK